MELGYVFSLSKNHGLSGTDCGILVHSRGSLYLYLFSEKTLLSERHGLPFGSRILYVFSIRLGVSTVLPNGNAAFDPWDDLMAVLLRNRIHFVRNFIDCAL